MPSKLPVSFTVDFDDNGDIVRVYDKRGNREIAPQPAADLPRLLRNITVQRITTTEVIICHAGSGEADPCIRHGNELWCW
jgi:hypothetical protein